MKEEVNSFEWLEALEDAVAICKKGNIVVSNTTFQIHEEHYQKGAENWIKQADQQHLQFHFITSDKKVKHIYASKKQISKTQELITFRDITDVEFLKSVNEINREKFHLLSNGTMEGIAMLDGEKVIDANERIIEISGYRGLDELIEFGVVDLFEKRDWKKLLGREGEIHEFEIESAQGLKVNIEAQLTPSENTTNNLKSLVVLDVTEKKRIKHDLLQTKERFRLLVESSPVGLLIITDNQIKYTNKSACDLMDVHDEESVYEEVFLNLFIEPDQQRIQEDLDAVFRGEKREYLEITLISKNKEQKPVGVQMGLTFFNQRRAIQVSMTDLSARVKLVREQMRASLAEETNLMLKEEINKHKETQKQLLEAERLNRSIVESSIDMIVAFDIDGNVIQFNHAASVEFGWTFEDARQLQPKQFLANESEFFEVVKELDENNYFVGELIGLRSSGETFQLLMSVALLRDDEGNTLGAVSVGRDTTDLQLAEQELRQSEERYRDILNHASDLVFLVDEKGTFTYANPAFFKTLGYDGNTLRQTNLQSILALEDDDWVDVVSGNNKEVVFLKSDGAPLKMLGGASQQMSLTGGLSGLRGIFLDVSEMRAHQRDAMMQSAKLESIFNSTRYLLMFTLDQDLRISSTNTNMENTLKSQFSAEIKMGLDVIGLLNPLVSEDLYKGQLSLLKRAQEGVQQQFELPLNSKDGNTQWYQVFVNPVCYDNEQEELSCIAYDITERKEIEQKVREALKEKEVLLQEVHHRVKNNLQVISSMLNLQRRFIEDPLMLNILEESQNRISTMSFIHESLYQNSDFSSISFSTYLERLTNNLIHSYSKISCQVELKSSLDEVHINLKQAVPCGLIVNELVSNALKYAFKDRTYGKLTLRVERIKEEVEIEISDDGVGLPAGFSFESNDSLGVYLVQALTEQIDGVLIVNNNQAPEALEKESGTSFLVRFTPITD